MPRYETAAEREFQLRLNVALIARQERRDQAARESTRRICLGAPTPADLARLGVGSRLGRID